MATPDFVSRRRLLAGTGAAGLAAAAGFAWWRQLRAPGDAPFTPDAAFPNPLRIPGADGLYGLFDVTGTFAIAAKSVRQDILPGRTTDMLAYEVEHQGTRLFNPLIRLHSGARIHTKFWNGLEESSIIHWHGLIVDSNNDGHPHYAIGGGQIYEYDFVVPNRAAMYWYHPHPHHLTGKQVYLGLGGLFMVEDDEELALQRALDLRHGVTDIPLVLHDRRFDADGQLAFVRGAGELAHGVLGTQVLVNWTPAPYLEAATRPYRFRILNASNARIYQLAFRSGGHTLEFQLIGNDGGLLEQAHTVAAAFLAPAERIDVVLDLRQAQTGDVITLATLAFDPMAHTAGRPAAAPNKPVPTAPHDAHAAHAARAPHQPMATADRTDHHPTPDIGSALDLMHIHVRHKARYDRALPAKLSRIDPIAANCQSPRVIALDHVKMVWRINGHTYQHESTPITVKRGATEVWNIQNAQASMPHPFHIHGFQFQILERRGSPGQQIALAVNDKGLAASDLGWKDTVLVWPGETVCIVIDFTHPFVGDQVYMLHCHNLEHEDQGMMLNLKVEA